MRRFTMFTDEELHNKVLSVKIGAGLHTALRELTPQLKEQLEAQSFNAAIVAALTALVLPLRPQLTPRTRDLMQLTDQLTRKGQR